MSDGTRSMAASPGEVHELPFGRDANAAARTLLAAFIDRQQLGRRVGQDAALVIGELVPKQFALRSPEPIAVIMARPMLLLSKITAPFVWLLDKSSAGIFRLLGLDRA